MTFTAFICSSSIIYAFIYKEFFLLEKLTLLNKKNPPGVIPNGLKTGQTSFKDIAHYFSVNQRNCLFFYFCQKAFF